MKKTLCLILFLLVVFLLVSCSQKGEIRPSKDDKQIVTKDIEDETHVKTNIVSNIKDDNFLDRLVYNENDSNKNLLLQFLHDEMLIVNYADKGDAFYYSDLVDENENMEYSKYFIVDMDGDGNEEFGYFHHSVLDIIKYNEGKEYFELWISVKSQQRPIGNGEMYAIITSQPIIYEYYLYDEKANLMESCYYRIGEKYNKEKDATYMVYEINGESVSEERWNLETEYFFKLKEEAPKAISYQELLE